MNDATDGGTGGDDVWAFDVALGAGLHHPDSGPLDRDTFVEWLWATLGDAGLAGIGEGAAGVEEAVAAGLVESALVLDAAEAPPDRDWVAGLPRGVLTCWFVDEAAARHAAAAIRVVAGCNVGGIRHEQTTVGDATWRDAFVAVDVPGFGVVRPAWEAGGAGTAGGRTTIFIDPGAGFGTGRHETTQLCLAAIAGWRDSGGRIDRVLDFGSGSGILGIAAAVLDAAHVDAVEIDARVHDAIRANAARNGVAARVCVAATLPPAGRYDLVVASIVAPVLMAEADPLCAAVRRDAAGRLAGAVVLGGLLADEVPRLAVAYAARLGVEPTATTAGPWQCLRFAATAPGDR
ncbi:MAG: 50S ribosomal protein L11 methyltransferase [Planctomycetaceae bacterium]